MILLILPPSLAIQHPSPVLRWQHRSPDIVTCTYELSSTDLLDVVMIDDLQLFLLRLWEGVRHGMDSVA